MRANAKFARRTALVLGGVCVAVSHGGGAFAQAPSRWATTPTAEDIADAYPAKAQQAGLKGRVVMTCMPKPSGAIEKCVVETEEPAGVGFGEAAKSLVPRFQLNPDQISKEPVRIALRFALEEVEYPIRAIKWLKPTKYRAEFGPPGPYFPDLAYRVGVGGEVWMKCLVAPGDLLEDCSVVEATPKNMGFEDSVRKMLQHRYIGAQPDSTGTAGPGPFLFQVVYPKPPPMRRP